MWFKLAGADFSKNNLGTMSSISSSYLIDYTGLIGMSGSPSSVSYAGSSAGTSKTASVVVTVTSGYTFKQGSTITASGGKSGTVFTADKDYTGGQTFTFSMAITANTKLSGTAEATGGSSSGGNAGGSGGSEPETPVNPPSGSSNYTLIHGNKYSSGFEDNTARASISPLTITVPNGVTITNKPTIKWAYYSNVNTNNMPSGTGSGTWDDYKYTGTGKAIGISFKKVDDSVFDWSVDSTNPADYFDVSDPGLWNGTAAEVPGSGGSSGSTPETPSGSIGDITALTLVDGNPWGSAAQQTAKNRVHSSTALYCPAGTTISCKDTTTYKWALRKVTSDTNLTATETSYKPDSVWTTKTSYTTTDNGYWCFILVKASDTDFDWSTESNKVSDYFTVS
jgi:hypothetical protein